MKYGKHIFVEENRRTRYFNYGGKVHSCKCVYCISLKCINYAPEAHRTTRKAFVVKVT